MELIEAASRCDARDEATDALRELEERTVAAGTEWAMGMLARSRALLDGGGGADALYVEAIKNSMPMFSPDGVMDADGAQAVRTLLAGSMEKVREAHFDLSKTYTNDFIEIFNRGTTTVDFSATNYSIQYLSLIHI